MSYAIQYHPDGSLYIRTLIDNIKFEIGIDPSTAKEIAKNIIDEIGKYPEKGRKPDCEYTDGELKPINN